MNNSNYILPEKENIEPALESLRDGAPLTLLKAPPGSGKTLTCAYLLGLAWSYEYSIVGVTQTYEQLGELARRMRKELPNIPFRIFVSQKRMKPGGIPMDLVAYATAEPSILAECVEKKIPLLAVAANLRSKIFISNQMNTEPKFSWMLVDEAWQLSDADFSLIAPLAEKYILIGDNNQIAPISETNISRWENNPSGPHLATPEAIQNRPWLKDICVTKNLTISYRLPQDTVDVIQPIFYPDMFFRGSFKSPQKDIISPASFKNVSPATISIQKSEKGCSLVGCELPENVINSNVDMGAVHAINDLVETLLSNYCEIVQEDKRIEIQRFRVEPHHIGIVASRNSQVHAIKSTLNPEWLEKNGIFVTTANKFQGLQRKIIILLHPLSGKPSYEEFASDAGRLCVSLTRHEIACFVVYRKGIDAMLKSDPMIKNISNIQKDSAYEGWKTNLEMYKILHSKERRVEWDGY